jgi:hypothetical protein
MLRRFMLGLAFLAPTVGVATDPVRAEVVERRIAASADDAEQNSSGSVSVVGSDLELVWDGNSQVVGLRFPNLALPQGAEITSAWVQFETEETGSTAVTVSFQAQAADNAPPSAPPRRTSRSGREPGSVTWSPPPWTTLGVAGPEQRTPNLAPLVQAVVDRTGWAPGNAIALIVTGSGTGKRTAQSFNNDPAGAPLLHVEYSVVEVNEPPELSILSPEHGSQWPADTAVPLVALASDPEDGALDDVSWVSNLDGSVGQGASTSRRSQSASTLTRVRRRFQAPGGRPPATSGGGRGPRAPRRRRHRELQLAGGRGNGGAARSAPRQRAHTRRQCLCRRHHRTVPGLLRPELGPPQGAHAPGGGESRLPRGRRGGLFRLLRRGRR